MAVELVGVKGDTEGLFIGEERRWREGMQRWPAGRLGGAPLMAWGRAAVLVGIVERRESRGRRRARGGEDPLLLLLVAVRGSSSEAAAL